MTYYLIDAGNGKKLERFGKYTLIRPCSQAVWSPFTPKKWHEADGEFSRHGDEFSWEWKRKAPAPWEIEFEGLRFLLKATDFGHLGLFPEHVLSWKKIENWVSEGKKNFSLLNLFAYSGGATLAAARKGAMVTHVDSSKGMVQWARENAELNSLQEAPIRWIVDDVRKFLIREHKRGRQYDAILLDPPSFGRGAKGEIFKIQEHLLDLLELCMKVLSPSAKGVFFACHTPGYTPLVMQNILSEMRGDREGSLCVGELVLKAKDLIVPHGSYACWEV